MAKVNISNVEVLDTEARFLSPFRFKITFECYEPLEEDLEWRLIYVSSAYNVALDQTLDSILVGPVPVGKHQFVFEADPPNTDLIPVEDAVGVTVVIVACLYREQEFIRVGYYVNNEYADEQLRETPPDRPQYDQLARHVLADNPRVTRRGIDWGDSRTASAAEQQQQQPADYCTSNSEFAAAAAAAPANGDCGTGVAVAQGHHQLSEQPQQLQQQPSSPEPQPQKASTTAAASIVVAKENCDPVVSNAMAS